MRRSDVILQATAGTYIGGLTGSAQLFGKATLALGSTDKSVEKEARRSGNL